MWLRRPIECVLFDIGGVVIHADFEPVFKVASMMFGCSQDVLAAHIPELIEDLERGLIDTYSLWDQLGKTLAKQGLGQRQDPEKCTHLWSKMMEDTLRVDEPMMDLCRRLGVRLPVGALSNTISEHANYLQRQGVYELFNPCILSFETGTRKPERSIYLQAAELMNTRPQNCLFIDDRKENIVGAKAVKMQTHHFTDQAALEQCLKGFGLL